MSITDRQAAEHARAIAEQARKLHVKLDWNGTHYSHGGVQPRECEWCKTVAVALSATADTARAQGAKAAFEEAQKTTEQFAGFYYGNGQSIPTSWLLLIERLRARATPGDTPQIDGPGPNTKSGSYELQELEGRIPKARDSRP